MNTSPVIMKSQVEVLFNEYRKSRKIDLTLDQFSYLLNLYPSLLVCMSDGVLDHEEWEGVISTAQGLAEEFDGIEDGLQKEETAQIFRTEFRYLLENIDRWQKKFLNALKSQLEYNQADKEFVLESMYLFANAADGISQEEQNMIDDLTDRLQLVH
jgi:outer membrane protein OmpA-like peptidoglycan-associated protein